MAILAGRRGPVFGVALLSTSPDSLEVAVFVTWRVWDFIPDFVRYTRGLRKEPIFYARPIANSLPC